MLTVASFPTYSAWLGSRPTSLSLRNQYNNARDAFERGRGPSASAPSSPRARPETPPYRGGGTRPSPGGPIPDTPPAPEPPRRTGPPTRRFPPSGGTPSPSTPPTGGGASGGGGGGRTGVPPSGRGSFGSGSGPSGYTGANPTNNPMPRPGSFGSGSGPSGFGGTRAPVGAGTSAAGKGASTAGKVVSAAKKGASFASKAGTVVGKVLNSPVGKMAKFVGGKVIYPLAMAKAAGDTFGAFEPGIDMLRYGHKAPFKDGVGGRDNRVNDMLGNISPLEAIKDGMTQEVLSNMTGGKSADVLKAVFPWRERPVPAAPAAATPRTPSAPARPSSPAPQQPKSIPDMGRQARGQNKAMRDPESYLGSAFDATLRKGIDTGRNYLRSQMNKDGLDADDQSKIMARFEGKIAKDAELKKTENKGGILQTINAKDDDRAQKTMEAYRGQRGAYRKGASYEEVQKLTK